MVLHYVEKAVARMDLAGLRRVAIDETAARRGHNYITLFVDIDSRKCSSSPKAVVRRPSPVRGSCRRPQLGCLAHQAGVHRYERRLHQGRDHNLTEAEITFDKFHAVKLVNDAVDKVRRAESKGRPELKRSRYLWLRNEPISRPRAAPSSPL